MKSLTDAEGKQVTVLFNNQGRTAMPMTIIETGPMGIVLRDDGEHRPEYGKPIVFYTWDSIRSIRLSC